MLWYVSTYRGVSFTKFMTLREESRAAITATIAAGATFDEAIMKARTTLEQDLIDHRKHGADNLVSATLSSTSSTLSDSTSASPQAPCDKCPQLKVEINDLQGCLTNRNAQIAALGGSPRKVHRSDTDRVSGAGGSGGGGGSSYRRGGGSAGGGSAGGRGNGRGRGRGNLATVVATPRRNEVVTPRREAAWLPCRKGTCSRHVFYCVRRQRPLSHFFHLRCAIISVGGRRQIIFRRDSAQGLVSE